MGTRVHYPEEVKWQVVKMKQAGVTNKKILEQLGIKDKKQIKTWMKWYRNGETHRFSQPVGKQYKYGKSGSNHLDEMTQKDLKIRQLEMQIEVLKKYLERQRGGKINFNGGCREFSGEISYHRYA